MVPELVEVRRAVRDGIARSFRRFKREYKLHGSDAKLFLSILPGMNPGKEVRKPTAANLLAEAREWASSSAELALECYAAARSLGADAQPDLDAFVDREFLGL